MSEHTLDHRTDAAEAILREGFRDGEGSYMFARLTLRGVFVSDVPVDCNDQPHQGRQAVEGSRRSTRVVTWTGGAERAMVVDGYRWTHLPGSDYEVRALTDKPLALRFRHRVHRVATP